MKIFILCIIIQFTYAQKVKADTVSQRHNILKSSQLNLGTHSYLVYMQNSKGEKSSFSIWERTLTKKAKGNFHFNWTIHFAEPGAIAKISTNLDKNFLPLNEEVFYSDKVPRIPKEMRKKFRFDDHRIISDSDTLYHNGKEIDLSYDAKPFNWQLDLETYSQLPFNKSKSFLIDFYHPGSSVPAYHLYEVTGEEKITIQGRERLCYVLEASYSKNSSNTWYIDKETFLVLKMKAKYGPNYGFKVLIDNLDK